MSIKERKLYIDMAKANDYLIECIEFKVDCKTYIKRNHERPKECRVPPIAIYMAFKRYEEPSLEEGFNKRINYV